MVFFFPTVHPLYRHHHLAKAVNVLLLILTVNLFGYPTPFVETNAS